MQRVLSQRATGVGHLLSKTFQTPKFLRPHAAGIDISDTSIKWIVLSDAPAGKRTVEAWGQESLPEGVVSAGVICDEARLIGALQVVRKKIPYKVGVHASLPEEAAFVFSMSVPGNATKEEISGFIDFELEARTPIAPSTSLYDFDCISRQEGQWQEIGVAVFPRTLADAYTNCFSAAGFVLFSLEVQSRAIARAVVSNTQRSEVMLLVDFGAKRSAIAILKCGIPIFTSTIEIGVGRAMPSESQRSGLETLSGVASALGSEVAKRSNYWNTSRNQRGEYRSPVKTVLLVGEGANLRGIGDYLSGCVQSEVIRPNVWANVCSFEEYIPPINRHTSLQYATAVGLALSDRRSKKVGI